MVAKLKGGTANIDKQIEVPFSISGTHLLCLDAQINGQTHKLVLDTGGITMIDSSLCADLNLVPKPLGKSGEQLVELEEISLGEVQVKGLKAFVTSFSENFHMGTYGIRELFANVTFTHPPEIIERSYIGSNQSGN
ncbi:MAG: hypothetical protein PHI68_04785 [Candidatus Cloacimonetes bacterium]|nr:hypothetical protein [Candidatus Cloacimonadota bacterium]